MFIADPSRKPTDVFLYTLHPARPAMLTAGATDAEKMMAGQHWAHSIELLKKGVIVFAGRTMNTTAHPFQPMLIASQG